MQNGYFLHLIVVLVAVTSRMDLLMAELQDGVHQGERNLRGLLDVLDVSYMLPSHSSF
jgi:hypothetical protein